ncbi:MAG: T9SS type A sorting domain-containing protein [Lentimicrobium sp.]|nr:T9SS type A sorting domain-containing protein [Lentimicrobium sp.]
MKIFTRFLLSSVAFFMATSFLIAQSQLQLEGLYSEGEGGAAWDANGSGPEPYGNGHGSVYYYTASRDYVDPTYSSGAHLLDNMNGFPLFQQALLDNGFTVEQVTLKISLSSMGEDIEGSDWFTLGNVGYANFYPAIGTFDLNGQPLFEVIGNYAIYISGPGSQEFESGYLKVNDISGNSPDPVKNVAAALQTDLGNEELKFYMQVTNAAVLSGNGRSGGYFNVNCTFEKGLPTLPLQGLYADNEGTAGWNADGTGPEPYGNGHGDIVYYSASVDYDGINPDPDACLGHVIEGSDGFFNTLLQLQYRGYEVGDLKLKMGLCSLGPDVFGEDWGYENGFQWLNEYNNSFIIELNGEPILEYLQDTNKMTFINPGTVTWSTKSSVGKVYNISANASLEAQYVAQSFLRDLGSHYVITDVSDIHYVGPMPSGNGRSGVYYELGGGAMLGVHQKATFIPEGPVSGVWTVDNSPYFIDGHLSIENGQTLTIEPGVEVKVRGPYHFTVQGCVKAEGTADENIVFTRSNPNLWWDGFDYDETPTSNQASIFDHCIFEFSYGQGSATGYNGGGAMAIKGFDGLSISNSVFRYNKVDLPGYYPPSGGAVGLWNASPKFSKCIFHDNEAEYGGAFFSFAQSDPIVSNCLFYNNYGQNGGAIACYDHCDGIYINNTISNNSANKGGALYFYDHSNPQVINNILWGNEAAISGNQVYNSFLSSRPGFYYCDIEEGQAGFGGITINGDYLFNIQEGPMFSGDPDSPYSLLNATSPCWNAGTPDTSAWFYPEYLPETCLGSAIRISDGCIDIGAYETILGTGINAPLEDATAGFQVYPNPVNKRLTIEYQLQEPCMVTIELLDLFGRQVTVIQNEWQQSEKYKVNFDATALPPGIYFCRLLTGNKFETRKIIRVH